MKLLICLLFHCAPASPTIQEIVIEFHGLTNKNEELTFIKKYTTSHNPSVLAYVMAAKIKQAEYYDNPLKKLSIFSNGNSKLNKLVQENEQNIHLRYVRFVIQERVPAWLGDRNYLKADKEFLIKFLAKTNQPKYLIDYIQSNTSL